MTLDEAIKHCLDIADGQDKCAEISVSEHAKERISQCAADHRQLAEWLTELKEAKRLLKAAVEDFSFVSEKFINSMDSSCSMFNHIAGCVKDCPMSSSDDYGRCKWRYTDEALELIES